MVGIAGWSEIEKSGPGVTSSIVTAGLCPGPDAGAAIATSSFRAINCSNLLSRVESSIRRNCVLKRETDCANHLT
jgi:hypothetical protein